MPVTPFHFGPGLALKGALGNRFSLLAFIAANVAIDIEPAYYLIVDDGPLHRFAHTWLGATLLGLGLLAGWTGIRWLACRIGPQRSWPWLGALRNSRVLPVGVGILLAVWSHVALDSIMHGDMSPFAPFAVGNPWQGLLSLEQLHWLCIMTGIVGVPLVFLRRE